MLTMVKLGGNLCEVLRVLAELKCVLKEDTGLDLNISKTVILPKVITQQVIFDVCTDSLMTHHN